MQIDLPFSEETPPPRRDEDRASRRLPARAFRDRRSAGGDDGVPEGWVIRDPAAVLTVSQVGQALQLALDRSFPRRITVRGELANLVRHASGHMYFTLRDAQAALRCAMFRSSVRTLKFEPENGIEVDVRGELDVYQARGEVQLVADSMRPAGAGAQMVALEALKQRLAAEGLLDPGRKRSLPRIPAAIGVVTSPSGAAVRDILKVVRRRAPFLPIVVAPASVQGDDAERTLCAALERLGASRLVDVIVVARGGGSFEDLHAFNAESVARAIVAAPVPVVAGVGHETDVTLADLVADVRAATPSHAAELVTPSVAGLAAELAGGAVQVGQALARRLERDRRRHERVGHSRALMEPARLLHDRRRRLDELTSAVERGLAVRLEHGRLRSDGVAPRLAAAVEHHWSVRRQDWEHARDGLRRASNGLVDRAVTRLGALGRAVRALGPHQVLARGYVVARHPGTGSAITSARDAAVAETLLLSWLDGQARARVEEVQLEGGRPGAGDSGGGATGSTGPAGSEGEQGA